MFEQSSTSSSSSLETVAFAVADEKDCWEVSRVSSSPVALGRGGRGNSLGSRVDASAVGTVSLLSSSALAEAETFGVDLPAGVFSVPSRGW